MLKLKKRLLIGAITVLIIVGVVVAFISPIAKYLIQKYDTKYTGRQITLNWVYLNPFTGYLHLSGLKIYEHKSDSIFIEMDGLTANFELLKLISNTLEIKDFTLNKPLILIKKNNTHFNFDDLVTKFSSKEPVDTTKEGMHTSIKNIKIKNGHFYYLDHGIPVNFSIKKVNIDSKDGYRWDKDDIAATFSFLSEKGVGGMKGVYGMNLKTSDYKLDVKVNKFDLKVIEQYLKGVANYGSLRANMDADLKTLGNLKGAQNISIQGELAINDFHFGKNQMEDYLSFEKVVINMKEVNPKNDKYFIDSISLIEPFFKYEQYDSSNNLETMFGQKGGKAAAANANKEQLNIIFVIGRYVEQLAKNFLHSNYKVNKLGIYKCKLQYNDYTLAEKFSIELNPLQITADSVYKSKARVNLSFKSDIKPYGTSAIRISVNPQDTSDFDIYYNFQKIPLSMFNPYTISLTSFPFDRGTLEINGAWNVRNGNIKSKNHLLVIDPRLSDRVRKKGIKWIPMRIAMAFTREQGNVIDYEIPISGNLTNPKFHLKDIIWDIIENIFIKPITTPYRIEVKKVESKIEKSLNLNWKMNSSALNKEQDRFINQMANFLEKNKEATIVISQQVYELKEREYILLYEARKKYYLERNNKNSKTFTEKDAEIVNQISIKDPGFLAYLNKKVSDPLIFTVQNKCMKIVSSSLLNAEYNKLSKARAAAFKAAFIKKNVSGRIKFTANQSVIPYNGFSYYKIAYKGEYPETLLKAYRQMNQLNDEAPRLKFKTLRSKLNKKN